MFGRKQRRIETLEDTMTILVSQRDELVDQNWRLVEQVARQGKYIRENNARIDEADRRLRVMEAYVAELRAQKGDDIGSDPEFVGV